ncbi:hypothetical protein ACFCXS_08160 [Streptomyces sp. NPDC056373]|uniref:hypothetical protein n=1 Tax=Streptomyces sp. NPDC056373 TaxID=3345798 RepID=UPI0035DE0CA4
MRNLIRRTAHWLGFLLTPGTGKHRRTPHQPHPTAVRHITPPPAYLPHPRSPYGLPTPLDGADSRLVRPYLLAHAQEAALWRCRHLDLDLVADFGIDPDEYLIGAQGVAV